MPARTRPLGRDERSRRRSQLVGAVGVAGAAALPPVLWHRVLGDVLASASSQDGQTVAIGLLPWVLMGLGLLCAIPVALTHLRDARFHRPGSGAWVGWGITLYLLGFALATQVAQIHDLHA